MFDENISLLIFFSQNLYISRIKSWNRPIFFCIIIPPIYGLFLRRTGFVLDFRKINFLRFAIKTWEISFFLNFFAKTEHFKWKNLKIEFIIKKSSFFVKYSGLKISLGEKKRCPYNQIFFLISHKNALCVVFISEEPAYFTIRQIIHINGVKSLIFV